MWRLKRRPAEPVPVPLKPGLPFISKSSRVSRKNASDLRMSAGEHMLMAREAHHGDKAYIDPCVRDRQTDFTIPSIRQFVAERDPYLNRLTYGWAAEVLSEVPRFIVQDPKADPLMPSLVTSLEVFQDVRSLIETSGLLPVAQQAFAKARIHGWSVTVYRLDPITGQPTGWVFSADDVAALYRAPGGEIARWDFAVPPPPDHLGDSGELIGKTVSVIRIPGFGPTADDIGGIGPVAEAAAAGDPEAAARPTPHIFLQRKRNIYGFGESAIRPVWDPVIKLFLKSHADMLRTRLFTKIVLPPTLTAGEMEDVEDWVDSLDERTHMTTVAGYAHDAAGNLIPEPELPKIEMTGMVAPGTADMGAMALQEELQRVCIGSGFTMRYFTGDPGGALAAAAVDMDKDTRTSIDEFNCLKSWWTDLLLLLGIDPMGVQPICSLQYNYDVRQYQMYAAAMAQAQGEEEDDGGDKSGDDADAKDGGDK